MDYFSFEEQRVLLFVTLTYITITLLVAWVFLIDLKGMGMWRWLSPPMKRRTDAFEKKYLAADCDKPPTRQVALRKDLYEVMSAYLPIISEGKVDMTQYLAHILEEHLDRYRDEVTALCREKSDKEE